MADSGPSMTLADFVIQEAKEKTFEIDIKALKQFEKEKAIIVEKELQIVREDYQKKLRKVEMQRKMLFFSLLNLKLYFKYFKIRETSSNINRTRLMLMEARNKCMRKIFGETQFKLFEKITKDKSYYRKHLENLVAQVKFFYFFTFSSI